MANWSWRRPKCATCKSACSPARVKVASIVRLERRQGACRARRGQQRGCVGHGRTLQTQLPARHEDVRLDKAQCPDCGLAFNSFAGTEDAQVLEIEVKAYRRVIHRHRYMPSCQCGCVSGIITAPAPARLINRGKFGIPVCTSVQDPKLQRSALSRKLCQLWRWTKPNGDSKDMTCRVALLRMQADGLIELPPSRIGVVRKRAHFAPTAASALFQPRTSGFTRFARTSPPHFASRRYGFTEYLPRGHPAAS